MIENTCPKMAHREWHFSHRVFAFVVWLGLGIWPAWMSAAEDSLQLQAQEIKAGLLYNFLKYTQWPETTPVREKITVCLFESDPMAPYLQPMNGRTVSQREITVSHLRDIRDTERCHLLFIGAGEKKRWPAIRDFLAGKPVLTVSDSDGFTEAGGMIEFGRSDNRIHASLNMAALAAAGLRVQDRMMKLVSIARAGAGTP